MIGPKEHGLVGVVPYADEGVVRVREEATKGKRDAGRMVELEDEAAVAYAELESGRGGRRGVPLDAEADDEAAVANLGEEEAANVVEPCTDDGGGGGEGDVDVVVLEEVDSEGSESVRLWAVMGFDGYVLVVHGCLVVAGGFWV